MRQLVVEISVNGGPWRYLCTTCGGQSENAYWSNRVLASVPWPVMSGTARYRFA